MSGLIIDIMFYWLVFLNYLDKNLSAMLPWIILIMVIILLAIGFIVGKKIG